MPKLDQLRSLTASGRHVLLELVRDKFDAAECRGLVRRLASELVDHAVFESGDNKVTVCPVIPRTVIREQEAEFRAALADYRRTSTALADHLNRFEPLLAAPEDRANIVCTGWKLCFHGVHCRCTNTTSGQIVEVPIRNSFLDKSGEVDPYFFAEFLRTTPYWRKLAMFFRHDYHDAKRVLETLTAEAQSLEKADAAP